MELASGLKELKGLRAPDNTTQVCVTGSEERMDCALCH